MLTNYQLADPQVNAKGGRYCPLSDDRGPAWILPCGKLFAPFGGPSTYDGGAYTPRQTLELRCSTDLETLMQQFDEWVLGYLETHAERFFKKKLTRQQLLDGYKSPMHRKGDYPPNLRCKIDLEGRMACRYWSEAGAERGPPDDYKLCDLKVRIMARSMWFMQKDFGFTLQITDMQIFPRPHICPFAFEPPDRPHSISEEEDDAMEDDGS